ncbi:MAG TPA: GNAT family N-acetyltransferase [Alloacidobacterium sp.]|nr:GNAT family N-acetyltransferase [Alloacidobacterium sp.]
MMLEYNVEELTPELIAETIPIQQGYWEEVAGPFHQFPPDVDWRTYMVAQQRGCLKVLCGRVAGVLKAGAFVVITPHPHYACIAASLPLLFVHPDYRKGREGLRLVRRAEEEAIKAGAQLMMTHGGVHNGVYRLFEAMKYEDFGRYFVKVIGDTTPVFKVK